MCEPMQSVLSLKECPSQQQSATELPPHLKELYQAGIGGLTPACSTDTGLQPPV